MQGFWDEDILTTALMQFLDNIRAEETRAARYNNAFIRPKAHVFQRALHLFLALQRGLRSLEAFRIGFFLRLRKIGIYHEPY